MKVKLGKFIESVGDGIHGTPIYSENGKYYFINGNCLNDGEIVLSSDLPKISEKEFIKIQRCLGENTILLSINGTLGKTAYYNNEPIALGKSVCYINVKENVNKYFVNYVLQTSAFKKYMLNVSTGSTIKNFAPKQVMDYEFDLPSGLDSDKVAKTLKNIDDKIKLNSKIILKLESLAKTIYDYWFLQFEFPNEDGKPYKSSDGKMVWNDELKREIPEGWKVFQVKDFCDVFTGKKDVNQALDTGKYKFFSCAPGYKYSNDKLYTGKAILISGNGSYTGRTIFVNDSFDLYQRTYACVMKPNYDNMLEYIFYTMKIFFVKRVSGGTHGSAIPYIVYNDIANEHFYYNKEVVDTFVKTIEPIQEHIIELSNESQKLISLRDFLLPMLMNGQVTFKEEA